MADDGDVACKALTETHWKLIETISQTQRAVGQMMQREARGEAESDGGGFDVGLWRRFSEAGEAKTTRIGATRKADRVREALLEKHIKIEAERAREASRRPDPPRCESFKGRESHLAALQAWAAEASSFRALVVLVSVLSQLLPADTKEAIERQALGLLATLSSSLETDSILGLVIANETTMNKETLRSSGQRLRLYPEQRRLADLVIGGIEEPGLLIRYVTPPSGGKTSAAALLGAILQNLAKPPKVFDEPLLVYVCSSDTVRVDVARTMLGASVPFVIWSRGLASPSNSCFHGKPPKKPKLAGRADVRTRAAHSFKEILPLCQRPPAAYVCDPVSAAAVLSLRKGRDVLMFDEPTADDSVRAGLVKQHAAVLLALPRPAVVILASATLPALEAMPSILKLLGCRAEEVTSERMGVSLYGFVGEELVVPHRLIPRTDLLAAAPEERSHWLRFYCPRAVRTLRADFGAVVTAPPLDLLSHSGIRAHALAVLEAADGERLLEGAASELVVLDLRNFCTSAACSIPGCTLVIANAPDDFLAEALDPLLSSVPPLNRLEKIGESAEKAAKERARFCAPTQLTRDERREMARGEPEEETTLLWPPSAVINSQEHISKYAPQGHPFDREMLRSSLPMAREVLETTAVRLVEAALSGVLCPESRLADEDYTLQALALAETGRPSFVAGGNELVHGANLAVDRVVLPVSMLDHAALRQACGRAGRHGKSLDGQVWFSSLGQAVEALRPPEVSRPMALERHISLLP